MCWGRLLLAAAARPRLQLFEEVMTLIVNEDESWEVLNGNLPNGFHTQFWILYALNTLDAAL